MPVRGFRHAAAATLLLLVMNLAPTPKGTAAEFLLDNRPWQCGLLVDVGSTFTKVIAIDSQATRLAQSQSPTTIDQDVMAGVSRAINGLGLAADVAPDWVLVSSSAAGGLRMASVGLTAALSGRAGELSALGAGAKVVCSEHGLLGDEALARIEQANVHLVLLAGGIDGGNADALLHNASALSGLTGALGFIVAGNTDASQQAASILTERGHDVLVVDNVYPRPGEIRIPPTREAVRELFMRHITRAKGLGEMLTQLQTDCEPTPLAVSRAVGYLSDSGRPVVFVDVGGATTDVHSQGGLPTERRNTEVPTPEVMRTVEGDLGMRHGAPGIVEAMSGALRARCEQQLDCDLEDEAARRKATPDYLPETEIDRRVDDLLCSAAATIAIERHAGRVVVKHRPWGDRYQVVGKDLRPTDVLVATGGAFRFVADANATVRRALEDIEGVQGPTEPRIAIDLTYTLYAVGLLAAYSPELASRLAVRLRG